MCFITPITFLRRVYLRFVANFIANFTLFSAIQTHIQLFSLRLITPAYRYRSRLNLLRLLWPKTDMVHEKRQDPWKLSQMPDPWWEKIFDGFSLQLCIDWKSRNHIFFSTPNFKKYLAQHCNFYPNTKSDLWERICAFLCSFRLRRAFEVVDQAYCRTFRGPYTPPPSKNRKCITYASLLVPAIPLTETNHITAIPRRTPSIYKCSFPEQTKVWGQSTHHT